jgi:uncharacterized membrane protein
MPEDVLGLPVHPLSVHAPLVLVPLAAILTLIVAASPDRRAKWGWLTAIVATVALASTYVARLSGQDLEEALFPDTLPPLVADHKQLGSNAIWFVLALWLAVCALLLLDLDRRRRTHISSPILSTILAVVTIMVAMAAIAQIFWTGWSGAKSHWQQTTAAAHSEVFVVDTRSV